MADAKISALPGVTGNGAATDEFAVNAATISKKTTLQKIADFGKALLPNKNGIVNGALLVWQDGTSFAAIADATYIADNLKYNKTGTMVHTAAQAAGGTSSALSSVEVPYYAQLTLTTQQATLAIGDLCTLSMFIEGYQWRSYHANQFTCSFIANFATTGIHCFSVRNSAQDYSYVGEFTIATAGVDQLVTITVTAPPAGTWLFDTSVGAQLTICLASGTTGQGVAGWQTGNKFATANQVNTCNAAVNAVFKIAMERIDSGSVAMGWSPVDLAANQKLTSAFRYGSNAAQAIAAATFTKVLFQVSSYDHLSEVSSSTFTAKRSGTYRFTAGVGILSAAAGNRLLLTLYKNGAEDIRVVDFTAAVAGSQQGSGSGDISLSAGDTVEAYAYTSTAVSLADNGVINHFSGSMIA